MLSRVAERIYWSARYLERVENTARLVKVYTALLMDLPRSIDISWFNLITINSNVEDFEARFIVRDEKNVVTFILNGEGNQSSLLSSLQCARENLRTTRDVMPEGMWELINEHYIFVKNNIHSGLLRSNRHEFLEKIIHHCELIRGHMVGTMPRDFGWQMWRMGLSIERADMTTRILDAGVNALGENTRDDENSLLTVWGNVLQSLSAHLAYRRVVNANLNSDGVIDYLVNDCQQPRGIRRCILQLGDAAKRLPKKRRIVSAIDDTIEFMDQQNDKNNDDAIDYSDYFNELQIRIGSLHQLFAKHWFSID